MLLFPETAPTGLINNGDPNHDLPLGEKIPEGPTTKRLARLCKQLSIYIGITIFERDKNCLYDTAILIDTAGSTILKYRRISKGWRTSKADPKIYRLGNSMPTVKTSFGKLGFLICGDLFDDKILKLLRQKKPDMVLFLVACSFDDRSCNQCRWNKELKEYTAQIKKLGATTLMTNYLSDKLSGGYFGGAAVVSKSGKILNSLPLGREGILLADL